MLDAAACCKIRTAQSSIVNVESLRELKTLLRSTLQTDLDLAIQAQRRYLLNAGGADVAVVEPTEIRSTGFVCSAESETGLAGTVTQTQQKVLRLWSQLLRQRGARSEAGQAVEEGRDE